MKYFCFLLATLLTSCGSTDIIQYKGAYVKLEAVKQQSRYNEKDKEWVTEILYYYRYQNTMPIAIDYPLDGDTTIGSKHLMPIKK